MLKAYQVDRFLAFVDPDLDPRGAGYNVEQARIAIGNGGLFGQGLFHGSQTRSGFVPEQQTDFVFTVAGEELGLVGAGLLIALLAVVIWRPSSSPATPRTSSAGSPPPASPAGSASRPSRTSACAWDHAGHRRASAVRVATAAPRCSPACSPSGAAEHPPAFADAHVRRPHGRTSGPGRPVIARLAAGRCAGRLGPRCLLVGLLLERGSQRGPLDVRGGTDAQQYSHAHNVRHGRPGGARPGPRRGRAGGAARGGRTARWLAGAVRHRLRARQGAARHRTWRRLRHARPRPDSGAPAPDGSWWFLDAAKARIAHYDSSGHFLDQVKVSKDLLVPVYFQWQLPVVLADGTLVAVRRTRSAAGCSECATADRRDPRGGILGPHVLRRRVPLRLLRRGKPVEVDPVDGSRASHRALPDSLGDAVHHRGGRAAQGRAAGVRDHQALPITTLSGATAHVGVQVRAGADDTLHLFLTAPARTTSRCSSSAPRCVSPSGEVAEVEALPDPFNEADPGSPAQLVMAPGSSIPMLVYVLPDGVHVYERTG